MSTHHLAATALVLALLAGPAIANDQDEIAALDTAYQAAVKVNDAETMARIFHPDFMLVNGEGAHLDRDRMLHDAREKLVAYEVQDEIPGSRTVRVYGDTGIVTAKLRLRYTLAKTGQTADRTLWFSDTYVRTPAGWRYAFGQASLALPAPSNAP